MRKVLRIGEKGKVKLEREEWEAIGDLESKVALIQDLIPLGLAAVADTLNQEVEKLVGARYSREEGIRGHCRWGSQMGSVYLADQKLPITRPRVRNRIMKQEVPLAGYALLQQPRRADEGVLKRVLRGLSCRKYEDCAEAVPEAFGLSPSTVSRRFIRTSAEKLKALMERDLSGRDFVALFIDGKGFADDEMIIALGITITGEKVILGFIQSATENEKVVREFLNGLLERGFHGEEGLLCIIDGAKGLRSAVRKVFRDKVIIQRCQWHKRENVISYLPKTQQVSWRRKLQRAYAQPTYEGACQALNRLKPELRLINESAVASLEEGLEETLTLHRLGLFTALGKSFKTTNCIESLMAQVGQYTDKVDYWKNSSQKQRWVSSALMEIECRLRRVEGHRHLYRLRDALKKELNIEKLAA
jgi:transposase-like protein